MKNTYRTFSIAVTFSVIASMGLGFFIQSTLTASIARDLSAVHDLMTVPTAEAAVSDWQKGISVFPTWSEDFAGGSFQQSMRNAKNMGATHVALVIPIYQGNNSSSDIYGLGDTPSDSSLISAINFIKSIGMRVMIKPHLETQSGDWRANINASNRDAWFANWGNYLNHLGDIGKQTGAESICIGTELITMATYTSNGDNTRRWNTLISNLRQHFPGFLTYSANWGNGDFAEEVPHIGFWPALDFIGISAYYPLAEGQNNPSVDALKGSWNFWDSSKIRGVQSQFNKPILLTEIGYRSSDNAHNQPWNPWLGGGYNANEQSNDYEALFQYWNNQSYMKGVYLWNWESNPNGGGNGNTNYTPQNKPAQAVIANWFGSSGGGNPPPPPPPGGGNPPPGPGQNSEVVGSWTIGATAPALAAGQQANIGVRIGISDHATNVAADVEIYSSSGQKVLQKTFEGQNISSSPTTLSVPWTPSGNGTYTLKVGIFNNTWSNLYIWNDAVASLQVGSGSGNPPPPPPPPGSGNSEVVGSWTIGATAPTLSSGQQAAIPLNIKISDHATNVIIDAEIYNSSGQKVLQKTFENQNITSQTTNLSVPWTPSGNGTYTLKVGIFNPNWSTLYIWNDAVASLQVGSGGGNPPPPPAPGSTIDIWWPGNGANVSGVQPFKGLLQNRSLSEYSMFWQVDGNGLNSMSDSQQDYPHKESLVDVNPWNWRGNGPYNINFIAKDPSGNIIAQKTVPITIAR